jgi:hypothetical protein
VHPKPSSEIVLRESFDTSECSFTIASYIPFAFSMSNRKRFIQDPEKQHLHKSILIHFESALQSLTNADASFQADLRQLPACLSVTTPPLLDAAAAAPRCRAAAVAAADPS